MIYFNSILPFIDEIIVVKFIYTPNKMMYNLILYIFIQK